MRVFDIFMKNSGQKLIGYSHNRDVHYKVSGIEIFEVINKFFERKSLNFLLKYYEKAYSLPAAVIKQRMKQNIVRSYNYRKAKFRTSLNPRFIFSSMFKFWGAVIYALINSDKKIKKRNFYLIIDDIASPHELERFKKIISLFGKDNVLIITTSKEVEHSFPEYHILLKQQYKSYNIGDVLRVLRNELALGFWLSLYISFTNKANLLPTIMLFLKDYLGYKTIFRCYGAKYILQEKHYSTNAIRNFLFKQAGGIASTTIQKNILQLDQTIYYIDIDVFLSLGNRTVERAYDCGGNIGKVLPVGSLFMEYYWFNSRQKVKKDNDIILLGINIMNAYDRQDSYTEFMSDYYGSIKWLADFKKEFPQYNIIIKHHFSASEDEIENDILSGSGIIVLKDGNSYDLAFKSRCAVTFGSTMGYELNAHGVKTYFFDPGYRCSLLPDLENDLLEGLRLTTYDEFRNTMIEALNNSEEEYLMNNSDDLCLKSERVSEKIYQTLSSGAFWK